MFHFHVMSLQDGNLQLNVVSAPGLIEAVEMIVGRGIAANNIINLQKLMVNATEPTDTDTPAGS